MSQAGGPRGRVWLWSMPLAAAVSATTWPVVLALGLSLMWLWWVMDARGLAEVKGRQVNAWIGITLLTGPAGWLAVKMLPTVQTFRERHGLGSEGSRPQAPTPVYARRRGQAEGRAAT